MANLNYLLGLITGGQSIKVDTQANLIALAATAPTVPFKCYATDIAQEMLYTGDVTKGTGGFIASGGSI
jgi:hypothetical protein